MFVNRNGLSGPNYATEEGRSEDSIYNPSTLIYSVEVVAVVLTTIIGILVNALLGEGGLVTNSNRSNWKQQQGSSAAAVLQHTSKIRVTSKLQQIFSLNMNLKFDSILKFTYRIGCWFPQLTSMLSQTQTLRIKKALSVWKVVF